MGARVRGCGCCALLARLILERGEEKDDITKVVNSKRY